MTPPLISLCILNTVNFTSYATFRTFYSAQKGWDVRNGFAGATAAPIAASISTVDNFIKVGPALAFWWCLFTSFTMIRYFIILFRNVVQTQMQVDNISRKQYRNSLHCFRILLKENGVKILYTGLSVNTLREAVFLGSYFCCYEGICASLIRNSFPAPVAVPTAGGLAGALGWLCSFPLDCIRARVQGQTIVQARNVRRKTAVAIAESLLNERGLIGLYSGVTPSIVRAFLVSGVRFSAYEFAIKFLTGSRPDVESPPCLLEGGEQWGTSG